MLEYFAGKRGDRGGVMGVEGDRVERKRHRKEG